MQFKDIFELDIERHMDGVIKPDAKDHLIDELKEYVFTPEIKLGLQRFCDEYNNPARDGNGAWISGFYGSGKSHLLKMLSYLLENAPLEYNEGGKTRENGEGGEKFERCAPNAPSTPSTPTSNAPIPTPNTTQPLRPLDFMKPKLKDEPALLGALEAACERVPSKSILFSAGAASDTQRREDGSALLFSFIRLLNEACGYFSGEQAFMAQMERDLDRAGVYEEFKALCFEELGKPWEEVRAQTFFQAQNITKLYDKISGQAPGTNKNIVATYQENYFPTPENFADWTFEYIQKQGPNFRLNFFVDEMGQFIANSTELMFMLQQIAELLNTKCKGRAWIVVVSQEDMDKLTGKLGKDHSKDFTKIQARFKVKFKILPNDANTVVKERLLKKADRALPALDELYQKEHHNFKVLLDFPDGSRHYSTFEDAEEFKQTYPLVPYQFTLFHDALVGLSNHDAFTGEYVSTGARNMLATAREVLRATKVAGQVEKGDLIAFDMMFEGMKGDLKSEISNSIYQVADHMNDELAVRILKALLLVKYTEGFDATPKNLRVLLSKSLHVKTKEFETEIEASLRKLHLAHYIEKEKDSYHYLTDEEQDIEKQIAREPVTDADMAKEIGRLLKDEIINRPKVSYVNKAFSTSFTYNLSVDNFAIGNSNNELSVKVYTDLSDYSQGHQIQAGMKELIVILEDRPEFSAEVRTWIQTKSYFSKDTGSATERREAIRSRKKAANETRRKDCIETLRSMLSHSFYGTCFEDITKDVTGSGEDRLTSAARIMVQKSYSLLALLTGSFDKHSIFNAATANPYMEGVPLPKYTEEVMRQINHICNTSSCCLIGGSTINSLEKTMKGKSYGWPPEAVREGIAVLASNNKVECFRNDAPLEGANLARVLSEGIKLDTVSVKPAVVYDKQQLQDTKDAYHFLTGLTCASKEVKAIAEEIKSHLSNTAQSYSHTTPLVSIYPFKDRYNAQISALVALCKIDRDWFIHNVVKERLNIKTMLTELSKMAEFCNGVQGKNYQAAQSFITSQAANLSMIDDVQSELADLEGYLRDEQIHNNGLAQKIKSTHRILEDKIDKTIQTEIAQAKENLEAFGTQFRSDSGYQNATEKARQDVDKLFQEYAQTIENMTQISLIRASVNQFKNQHASYLYSLVAPVIELVPTNNSTDGNDIGSLGGGKNNGSDNSEGGSGNTLPLTPPPVVPTIKTVAFNTIPIPYNYANKTLTTEDELDGFLEAFKADLLEHLNNNEKIIL